MSFSGRGKGILLSLAASVLACALLPSVSRGAALSTAAVTAVSTGSISFSWSSQNGNSYIAALATGPTDANFAVPVASATTAADVTSAQYFNLSANTSYYFRVKVSTDDDIGSLSNPPTSYIQTSTFTLPVLPTIALVGVGAGVSSATLTLTRGNNAVNSSYRIERSTVSDFASGRLFTATGTLPSGNTTFLGLDSNTTHYFRAAALWNGNLFQNASGYVTVSTQTLGVSPPIPVSFLVTTNTVTVTLSPNGNAAGTTLAITTGSFDATSSSVGVSAAGNTTLSITNLISNRVYSVRAAVLSSGQVVSSTAAVASTATFPNVPTSISTSLLAGTTITFTWSANNNLLSQTSYQVQISSNDPNFAAPSTEVTFGEELSSTTLSMLTTYYCRVKAMGINGSESAFSSTASFITLFIPVAGPSTPTALTVTHITTSTVSLSWIDNADNEQEYRILNSTGGIMKTVPFSSTFTQITGLSPDTSLNMRVAAYNIVNIAVGTTTISSHTLAEAPISPTLGTVTKIAVPLSWNGRGNPSTVLYEISQSTDNFVYAAGISTPVAFSAGLSSTSSVINNLSWGVTYYYRIRARNRDNILTDFTPVISTVTSTVEVFLSTGGSFNAGLTLVGMDPGVTISNFVLPNGTTQQSITSTQTANVTYSNSIVLRLSSGSMLNAIVGVDNLQVTSTQSIPIDNAGLILQGSSGTVTLRLIADSVSFSASTDSPQNLLATLPTVSTKTAFITLTSGLNVITVAIPPGTFTETVQLRFKLPESYPTGSSAFSAPGLGAAPSVLSGFGVGLEVLSNSPVQPQKPVPITFTYQDSDIRGMSPDILVISRFDEAVQKWFPLVSRVNGALRSVTAFTGHFSKFQLMALSPATDVQQAKIFPNPLKFHRGQSEMTFSNLTAGAEIKIYTLLGERVVTLKTDATGIVRWDARNENHERVASGVYVAMIEGAGGRKIVKVAVEK